MVAPDNVFHPAGGLLHADAGLEDSHRYAAHLGKHLPAKVALEAVEGLARRSVAVVLEAVDTATLGGPTPGGPAVDVEEDDPPRHRKRVPPAEEQLVDETGQPALGKNLVVVRVHHHGPVSAVAQHLVAQEQHPGLQDTQDEVGRVLLTETVQALGQELVT